MNLLNKSFAWLRGFASGLATRDPAHRHAGWQGYRAALAQAEEAGDEAFLDAEVARHQPTEADLARFRERVTPLESWPEPDLDAFRPAGTPAPYPHRLAEPANSSLRKEPGE